MTVEEYCKKAEAFDDGWSSYYVTSTVKNFSSIDMGEAIKACLGLSSDSGNVSKLIRSTIFYENPINRKELALSIGNIMRSVSIICDAFHFDMEKVMEMSVSMGKDKLEKLNALDTL